MSTATIQTRIELDKGRISIEGSRGERRELAVRLGFWSSLLVSILGVVYIVGLIFGFAVWGPAMPPAEPLQVLGGFVTLLGAPLLIVVMASVHRYAPGEKKILSLLALVFTILFAAMVSINRFIQFTVVRQGILNGQTEGLARFLPYDAASAMFVLEILGWGVFLSLAFLFAATVFESYGIERWIRWSFIAYGVLGIISAFGYALPISALVLVGFAAWGLILPIATVLLTVLFRQAERSALE